MSTIEKWMENHNGNWVWVDGSEGVRATVYANHDGTWGAIWNRTLDGMPRQLRAKFGCANDAQQAVEIADREGSGSLKWWPRDDEWIESKKGGFYRKVPGVIVSVKQAKSKSWYAVNMAVRCSEKMEVRRGAPALKIAAEEWTSSQPAPVIGNGSCASNSTQVQEVQEMYSCLF
jgi:hypothetical protein